MLRFHLTQYKIFRKYFKGVYYYKYFGIPVSPFWSETDIQSCQAKLIKIEKYEK